MHPIATGLLAAGLFGTSFAAVMLFGTSGLDYAKPASTKHVSKCEDVATIETLKQLALTKLKDYDSAQYLLKNGDYSIVIAATSGSVEFTLSGFRDRGKLGEGSICAALVNVRAINRKQSAEMSTEYSVEPTTDGKVMVSARFMPN